MDPDTKLQHAQLIPDLSAENATLSQKKDWSQNKRMEQVLRLDKPFLERKCILIEIMRAVVKSNYVHRLHQEENQCLSISWDALQF